VNREISLFLWIQATFFFISLTHEPEKKEKKTKNNFFKKNIGTVKVGR
jgi:hypothetical protein